MSGSMWWSVKFESNVVKAEMAMAILKNVMRSLRIGSPKSLTQFGLAHTRKYSLGEKNEHHEFLKASKIQPIHNTKSAIATMSDSGDIEVEAVQGYQVLPKEVTDEIGSIKLFNKWSYEDVEIRDISLT
jgi:hypothetical protein